MNDEEFSTLNELLRNNLIYETIRHGRAKRLASLRSSGISTQITIAEWCLFHTKNDGTWNNDCYIDEVDETFIRHSKI